MSIEIALSQGKIAIIDDVDADLAAFKWHAQKDFNTFYAKRNVHKPGGIREMQALHKIIAARMGIPGQVDHRDRNGLNDTRANLRAATSSQNNANKVRHPKNTSGFKGVCWHKARGRWRACIAINGRERSLGYYESPVQAALAYDRVVVEMHGDFAVPNFTVSDATDLIIRNSLREPVQSVTP